MIAPVAIRLVIVQTDLRDKVSKAKDEQSLQESSRKLKPFIERNFNKSKTTPQNNKKTITR